MSAPQIIITLSPAGNLVAELPGSNGSRRKVNFELGSAEEQIIHILQSQLSSKIEIGTDGAPTQKQVIHWERHGTLCQDKSCKRKTPHSHDKPWSDPSCPFCIAEGRFEKGYNREKAVKGLSLNEALRLGLLARGFIQSKNNSDIYAKPKTKLVARVTGSKIFDNKSVQWSKTQTENLIIDGKDHAKRLGFIPQDLKSEKKHSGATVRTLMPKAPVTKTERLNKKIKGEIKIPFI